MEEGYEFFAVFTGDPYYGYLLIADRFLHFLLRSIVFNVEEWLTTCVSTADSCPEFVRRQQPNISKIMNRLTTVGAIYLRWSRLYRSLC